MISCLLLEPPLLAVLLPRHGNRQQGRPV